MRVQVTFDGLDPMWEMFLVCDPAHSISDGRSFAMHDSCSSEPGPQAIIFQVPREYAGWWTMHLWDGGTYSVAKGGFVTGHQDIDFIWDREKNEFVSLLPTLPIPSGKRALDVGAGVT